MILLIRKRIERFEIVNYHNLTYVKFILSQDKVYIDVRVLRKKKAEFLTCKRRDYIRSYVI